MNQPKPANKPTNTTTDIHTMTDHTVTTQIITDNMFFGRPNKLRPNLVRTRDELFGFSNLCFPPVHESR